MLLLSIDRYLRSPPPLLLLLLLLQFHLEHIQGLAEALMTLNAVLLQYLKKKGGGGSYLGTIGAYASLVLLCFDSLNAKMITSKRETKKLTVLWNNVEIIT